VSAAPEGPAQSFVAKRDDVYVVSDEVGRRLRQHRSRRRCRIDVSAAAIDALADPSGRLDVLFMSSPAFSCWLDRGAR
jgi:hypothetical protein